MIYLFSRPGLFQRHLPKKHGFAVVNVLGFCDVVALEAQKINLLQMLKNSTNDE